MEGDETMRYDTCNTEKNITAYVRLPDCGYEILNKPTTLTGQTFNQATISET